MLYFFKYILLIIIPFSFYPEIQSMFFILEKSSIKKNSGSLRKKKRNKNHKTVDDVNFVFNNTLYRYSDVYQPNLSVLNVQGTILLVV